MPIRSILSCAGALVVLLTSAASAQLAFSSAPLFPPVPLPAIADVNGDGVLDACGLEYGCPAVYPGLADGTFAEPIGSSGYLASGFMLGDVNGDGRADLVAPHAFSGSTSALDVRLATPEATFLEASILSLPRDPGGLRLEDVSDDGVLDIVVMPPKLSIVRFLLLLGHGDGTFEPPQDLPTQGAAFLAFGDLDGDRHTDAVLNVVEGGAPSSGLTALFGEGAGHFGPPVTLLSGTVQGFELGDVLGVGRDSIVTRGTGEELRVLTLQPHAGLEETLVPVPGFVPFQSLHVRQVVGGGPLEIITFGDSFDGALNTVLVNDGAGHFSASPGYWAPSSDFATVTDANHDGAQDIVTTGGIVRGQGDGSFEPWYGLPAPALDLDTADVDGDGRADVLTTFGDVPALLHRGRLDGTLEPPVALDLGPAPATVRLLDVAGSPDVDALTLHVLWPASENLLGVSIGQGDGTFAPPVLTPVGQATEMAVADVDEDGRPDVLPWPGTLVLLNAGNGSWTALSAPSSLAVLQEAAGDFDGDGHVDLVRLLKQPANILRRQVLLGHGDGTFTPLPDVSIGIVGGQSSLTAVQLDADGQLDLAFTWAVPSQNPGAGPFLAIFPGNGDGTFGPGQYLEQPAQPLFEDLTGDGHVDLLTADLVAIEGSAAGLTDHVVDSPAPPMHAIVLADFDGDGVSDVAGIGGSGLMIVPRASGIWHELQHSLAGSQGYSKLQGVGSLQPASAVHLLVKHVPPATPVFVVLGLQAAYLPLHGGVMVPSADVIISGLVADGAGAVQLDARWPAGVPAGTQLFLQAWFTEGGGIVGATNAIVGTTPP